MQSAVLCVEGSRAPLSYGVWGARVSESETDAGTASLGRGEGSRSGRNWSYFFRVRFLGREDHAARL